MNRIVTLQERVEDYLAERRRLGYRLRTTAGALRSFARDVDRLELTGPLTIDVMSVWARQAKTHSDDLTIWARRLRLLGPFTTWLQQFEPATEVPDSTVFGRIGWRLAPHIFTEQEIIDLLTAARRLEPDLGGATYQALFGVLFLDFASQRLGKAPTALSLTDIVPDLILAFLDHLEQERHNTAQTRNLRLVALRAFLTFAARRDVTALQSIEQALGVPLKRFEQPMLGFLTREEMLAVIGEADETWTSQRDHLLLTVLYNTGARVSEMIGVQVGDVVLDASPCVHLHGKGRKRRSVPLWTGTVQAVRAWVRRNPSLGSTAPLLPNRNGRAMTRSNVNKRLEIAVARAAERYPSLNTRHIPPHSVRHSTAMHMLQSGVAFSVIALWLGHESMTTTHRYVEADLTMKQNALARLQEPAMEPTRYQPPDELMRFLLDL